jgi:hypothetical protein
MSGPKVVRVVTRDELLAQAAVTIARLDQCMKLWREAGEEVGQPSESDVSKALDRRRHLDSLHKADKFQEFASGANLEIAYLQADLNRRRDSAVEAKAREQARRRTARQNAKALMAMLQEMHGSKEAKLLAALHSAANGEVELDQVDRLLADGFRLLAPRTEAELTDAQREQARRLAPNEPSLTLQAWKASRAQVDPRFQDIDRLIAELRIANGKAAAIQFEQKAILIHSQADERQRSLQLDSLMLDLVKAKEQVTQVTFVVQAAKLLDAELLAAGVSESDHARLNLQQAVAQCNMPQLQTGLEECRSHLAAVLKAKAALARRTAVLQGLAKLGYAVNEGMSTALAQNSRIVIQKPEMPGYGVELAGGAEGERLQVRAVALSESRDKSRDLDAETLWCSDFANLKEAIADTGGLLIVEHAKEIGAVPLRVVETPGQGVEGKVKAKATGNRGLQG